MNKFQRRFVPVLLLGSSAILLQDAVLLAQASDGLDEIVVTARKREESLMEVPLAITAFSAESIESMGMAQLNDIQLYTPSLSFTNMQGGSGRNDRSSNALVFRGLSLSANTGITAGGQVFLDGRAYFSLAWATRHYPDKIAKRSNNKCCGDDNDNGKPRIHENLQEIDPTATR